MRSVVEDPPAVDLSEVQATVGATSYKRGRTYARANRVSAIEWDPQTATLTALVIGNGARYQTAAFFSADDGGRLAFDDGECTCPVGWNCKHVAAVVVAATGDHTLPRAAARVDSRPAAPGPSARSWETSLRALVDAPAPSATGVPLAIELAPATSGLAHGAARLVARLMRPGARGGWVNGSLAWNNLDSWLVYDGNHRRDHVELARALYALHRTRDRVGYLSSYGSEKTLDVSDLDGRQLWPLLDAAADAGLPLIHATRGLGEIPHRAAARVQLDVVREDERTSGLTTALQVDGVRADDLEPLLFLGAAGHGHGLVLVERGSEPPERRRMRLVRLARPAPAPLQRMVLERERLSIPAADLDRFAEDVCPSLRGVADVVSSDGSFTPPEVAPPELVLRARYGDGHGVDVGWEWAYRVGATTHRTPLGRGGGPAGLRDVGAERAVLAGAALGETGLEGLGLLDADGRPVDVGTVAVAGMDSARLTTELLPLLGEREDVRIEIDGAPADYRDVSDTLEIGLSTADVAGERDWFDLGVTIAVEGRELAFVDVFAALAAGEQELLLADGAHFSLLEPRLQSLRTLIEEARALTDAPPGELRISSYQAGLWAELAALGVVTEQAQAWERRAGALLGLDELADHEPPAALTAELRPYQREGFAWLASLWELGLGGILADDMGLGKTLQALAMIRHALDRQPDAGPFLVVAPTSVVPNWKQEAHRFAPGLAVEAVTDTLAKSGRAIDDVAAADVVVTTYTLLRLDAEAYRSVSWAGLVLDEAQAVKNHQSKTYRCVRELPAPFKLAITGTPMENNLMELWSLLSITAPGLFPDPKRFAAHFARPIERHGDAELLGRLRRRIRPLVKRRTKELVAADLPAKQEQLLEVDLHPRHRRLYDARLQRERQRILGLLHDFDRNRFTILRSITLLRQLSLHPGLVDGDHDRVPCAKLDALAEQLDDVIGGGHRALVFSQFTGFLAKVRERLDAAGIGYCYLDGRTRRRERVLDRFKQGDEPVFLISLKAGGFGLNLTEADYCFLLDPWWNPATEAQAIDRTHRIGQTRPVMVYRTIARETIEEKVVALARRKAELFSGVMDDGDLFAGSVTAADIRSLVS